MLVYKVVWLDKGKLLSVGAMDEMALEYAVGRETKPRIGYLFAFRDRDSAKTFVETFNYCRIELQIFVAHADCVEQEGRILMAKELDSKSIKAFWRDCAVSQEIAPMGSVYCRSVTLLEKVA